MAVSFLRRMLAGNMSVNDESAWHPIGWGATTAAGVPVNTDNALKLSVVWACVRLLSETIASLPLMIYRRLPDGGREEATNHPLYDLLHDRPNATQTAIEFRQMLGAHALLRGNGLARILPGARGFADQLVPLHPDRVQFKYLADGRLRYEVRNADNTIEVLGDEDILHLKGLSLDGKVGVSVITYAREAMGLDLAAEAYGARYFANGAEPRGVLKHPKGLSDPGFKKLKESWDEAHSGANQHKVAILEEGMDYVPVGLSNKDSQFLELRTFQAEDECRWFGVPPHMVGLTSKVTSWGSGIEQLGIAFVTYTLLPWLKRWEQAITRDLILAPQTYFVEHVVAGLLRGDLASRYNAYQIGLQNGWLSPNEIRQLENMNPRAGGDAYKAIDAGVSSVPASRPPAREAPAEDEPAAHYRLLVHEAAARVVRKEVAALGKAAKRLAGEGITIDQAAWAQAVDDFYADHADYVAQTLRIPDDQAALYVAWQKRELVQKGPTALDDWENRRVADLVELVSEAV